MKTKKKINGENERKSGLDKLFICELLKRSQYPAQREELRFNLLNAFLRNMLNRYLFLFFAIFIFETASSQIADSIKKWNIQQCIQYASEHNIQISTLRLSEQSSLQDLSAAKGFKIPSLSGSVSNAFNHANNKTTTGELVNQLTSSGSYSINSSIVLWNDNYINNNIHQKDLFTQSAGLSVQLSQNEITLLITQAYLDILLSKENEKYILDLVNTSDSRVKQAVMFYDAGSIAKKELLQFQAQLASDKYLLVQTQNSIRLNVLTLKQLLQIPTESPFDIAIPDSIEVVGLMPALQIVQQSALQNFPEIKIGKLDVEIASLDIEKAKAGFKPVLTANGGIGTGYNEALINSISPRNGYFTQTGNNLYQNFGIALSIPIFSNRINRTNLEKAKIAYQRAHLNYQNDQLVLTQAVEQAYIKAVNAQQAYDAASIQMQAATESYRITNEQIKLGAINAYDLLLQRNQYVQALQSFNLAKYTAVLQRKIFEFYMGNPVTL
jgi:outer membrane protein